MSTEDHMREAIALANSAKAHGNHPFGAVLVLDGEVVLRAENTVMTGKNFTHHAEMNLMNLVAASSLTQEEKARSMLVTSTEPCAMCSGAIVWGGVKKVVYGCPCEVLGEIAGDDFLMPCRNLFSLSKNHPVQVEGPVLEEEAKSVHIGFWDHLA
jgi:tRNA(Arg) A34 adenosine deaminase TadA|eukprot:gene641-445_t